MKQHSRIAFYAIAAGVFAIWFFLEEPDRPGFEHPVPQGYTEGSAVPCDVPLAWRVARIDSGFRLDTDEVVAALQGAIASWEQKVPRTLFVHDPVDGFPIRLIYGSRQARTQNWSQRNREVEELKARLEQGRDALDKARERYSQMRTHLDRQRVDLNRQFSIYNSTVQSWNQQGGAPRSVMASLRARQDALETKRRELKDQARNFEVSRRRFQDQQDRFNRQVEKYRLRAGQLEAVFSGSAVKSGEYRESTRTLGGRVVSVEREIEIYQFVDRHDLQTVMAHELGHALGLDHVSAAGALMSKERELKSGRNLPVQSADLELLQKQCPTLW